ncbi:MAG: hypothetical protein PHI58_03770 [Candidatus Omnitrophica bacterium]|nr:hypothetical protein [Candidatus Omnitrophota bacterium]
MPANFFFSMLVALCAIVAVTPVMCEDAVETVTVYTLAGEIVSLDTIKGVIVVKWTQTYPTIANDEITLKVPDDALITKGSDTIGMMDLNQFDRAVIKYRNPSVGLGMPIVVSMTVKRTS